MEQSPTSSPDARGSDKPLILVLGLILLVYAGASAAGWTAAPPKHEPGTHAAEVLTREVPHYWAVLPFTLLLAAIAILPLVGHTSHWWDSNLHKLYTAVTLALITLMYLALLHPRGNWGFAGDTLTHTVLNEYIPFIILLFSLYTISGGIRIKGDLPAHAFTNTLFIAVGGLLASFIGTTGAAMLLIRPLLETNSERKHVAHTVVFFIFVVCNCGGLLLPLGDPPLFLGYLQGVDFFWTLSLWKSWAFVNGALLAVYFVWDHFFSYPREAKSDRVRDETQVRRMKFSGVWPNALLLLGVILSVALLDPGQVVPGTQWHPWIYLREAVQLGLVLLSLTIGPRMVRDENSFNYLAIVEVGVLFIGIFVCMQPALEILKVRGSALGVDTPQRFFWASGTLSSVLDNAPTYLVFFEAAKGLPAGDHAMAGVAMSLLTGISLGSVLMGAMTYIGNGPNFMVKTIAEKSGVNMPSFFGYMLYSVGVLLPILAVNTWLFL